MAGKIRKYPAFINWVSETQSGILVLSVQLEMMIIQYSLVTSAPMGVLREWLSLSVHNVLRLKGMIMPIITQIKEV